MTVRRSLNAAVLLASAACASGYEGPEDAPPPAVVARDAASPLQRAHPGNSNCAHFCTAALPPGPERGSCVSEAAHDSGLCVECGADPGRVCVNAAGQHFCADLQNDPLNCGTCGHSCGAGGVCTNGVCCAPRTCTDLAHQLGTPFIGPLTFQCGSPPSIDPALFADGCGGTLNCGPPCATGFLCIGIGFLDVATRCQTCASLLCNVSCGEASVPAQFQAACGSTVQCGGCGPLQTCGGGGVPNQCG
jgi:hypothetical protein